MSDPTPEYSAQAVLDFWFPDTGYWKSREAFGPWIHERMQGGMDGAILADFADLTKAAAQGKLDHWAETPRGRLALLIALDQFPRSLWRDTPGAYAQDIKATRLAMEGIENGDILEIQPWERAFYVIALGHCEGPDHLERFDLIDRVCEDMIFPDLPASLEYSIDQFRGQNARVREIITRFGRHPHRNPVYGRVSSPEEEAYIAEGNFPHEQGPPEAN